MATTRAPAPPEVRFFRYVTPGPPDQCWLWSGMTGGSNATYGYFWDGTRKVMAHRWSYEHHVGPIPDGHEIDHVAARGCTSKLCVNPAHLEPVVHAVNRERGRLETCRAGLHDLTVPENVRWDPEGNRRGCAECHRTKARERSRANYTRKAAV